MTRRAPVTYRILTSRKAFRIPPERPVAFLIGGGCDRPVDGPDAFHEASLRRLFQRADAVYIAAGRRTHFAVSWAHEYARTWGGVAVIVETERLSMPAWFLFARQHADADRPVTVTDFPGTGAPDNVVRCEEMEG